MPSAASARLALTSPLAADPNDVPADIAVLIAQLEARAAGFLSGTYAARPAAAAGNARFLYYATDALALFLSDGVAWSPLGGVIAMSTAVRDALPVGGVWAGRTIFNTTKLLNETYRDATHGWQPTAGAFSLTTAERDALAADELYNGLVIYNETLGDFQARKAGAWRLLRVEGALTIRQWMQWTLPGEIKVPSGDTDYVPPGVVFAPAALGQTAKLALLRHRINSGTSVTFKMQEAGGDITGFTGLSMTTTATTTDPADDTLADLATLAPVVTAVSGTPKNGTIAAAIDVTV